MQGKRIQLYAKVVLAVYLPEGAHSDLGLKHFAVLPVARQLQNGVSGHARQNGTI